MTTQGKLLSRVPIPARTGRGVTVRQGQRLKVIAVQGQQVGDLFAFVMNTPEEFLSPTHTRSQLRRIYLEVGKPLYSNLRNPLLLLEEDTVRVHDLLVGACDPARYREMGVPDHPSCRENLKAVLRESGVQLPVLPDPVNLFMYIPIVDDEGHWEVRPSPARVGDYVLLQALQDLLVVVSACPWDLTPLNGDRPKDLVLEVYG